MKLPLIAIAGPTATGKSALGAALAHALNGEVVSCDSMQVYRGLETGTAQPTQAERALAPHHLTGFLDWDQEFSVSDYVAAAAEVIRGVHSRKKMPFLVGGTGLYARSLLRGFTFQPEARDEALRKSLYKEVQGLGPEALHARLAALDPQSAEEIHPNNVKRVLRALEYCLLSGEPFSRQAERSAQAEPPYRSLLFCTAFQDRQALYPDPPEQPLGGRLLHRPAPLIIVEHHLRPGQQLASGGDGAPFFPASPGGGGDNPQLLGEQGQNVV